ncbi:MAG: alpha/beta fold hydrolase [Verrucomicrobiota bacterium]|nr:alpha/beta fold hydrolase [Verrucomicrobiota bacterium]
MFILALHGFKCCGADFTTLAKTISGNWHCPELPGHGLESQLDCSPKGTLDCINKALINHQLSFTTQKILLGYSMGARAALLHATHHPDVWDALILISGNPGIENEINRRDRRIADAELADSIERLGVKTFLEFWQETPLICSLKKIPTNQRALMQTNRLKNTSAGLAKSLRQFGQGSAPNLWPEIGKLSMPALLITGEKDTKDTNIAKRMQKILPNASHVSILNTSHMPHLEQSDSVKKAIQNFLAK